MPSIKTLNNKAPMFADNDLGLMNPFSEINPDDYGLFEKRKYQHDLQAAQYAAELQLMQYQNQYNSAEQQAQRQREAGINPDLAGVSGEAAAGMQGNASPANIDAASPAEQAIGLTSTILSVFSGLADGALGAVHKIQDLDDKRLSGFRKAMGLVQPIGDTLGSIYGAGLSTADPEMVDFAVDDFVKRVPRRYRGMLRHFAKEYTQTPQFLTGVYGADTKMMKAHGENVATAVDPQYRGDADELMEALKPIKEAEFEIVKERLRGDRSKAEKMSAYWMNRDMGASAETENAQDKAEKGQADIMEIIRSGALKSVKKLEKAMDDGKWWASTALSALYASLMGISAPGMNFGHQESGQIRSNQYGTTENHSSSWNFGF